MGVEAEGIIAERDGIQVSSLAGASTEGMRHSQALGIPVRFER
jgi:hypothetical protein